MRQARHRVPVQTPVLGLRRHRLVSARAREDGRQGGKRAGRGVGDVRGGSNRQVSPVLWTGGHQGQGRVPRWLRWPSQAVAVSAMAQAAGMGLCVSRRASLHRFCRVLWLWGSALPALSLSLSLLVPNLSPQLTEGIWAALARCLSSPVTTTTPPPIRKRFTDHTGPSGRGVCTKAEGALRDNATLILIFRGGGFEETKALTQTPPLGLPGTDLRPQGVGDRACPLEGGMGVTGQRGDRFVSFI